MGDSELSPLRCVASSLCAYIASQSWRTWLSSWRSASALPPGKRPLFLRPGPSLPAACSPTHVYDNPVCTTRSLKPSELALVTKLQETLRSLPETGKGFKRGLRTGPSRHVQLT